MSNFSLEDIGINSTVAQNEFNITSEELYRTVENVKASVSSDAYFIDAEIYFSIAFTMLRNQMNEASNLNLIPHWINAMDNITTKYFDAFVCVSFLDCAHYSVSQLYEIFVLSYDNNMTEALLALSMLEHLLLNLTKDFSQSIPDVHDITTELQNHLNKLDKVNIFCSTPPSMKSPIQNQTLLEGDGFALLL